MLPPKHHLRLPTLDRALASDLRRISVDRMRTRIRELTSQAVLLDTDSALRETFDKGEPARLSNAVSKLFEAIGLLQKLLE